MANEREVQERCDEYRAAYEAANGQPATIAKERNGYRVNGTWRTGSEVDAMAATLRARVKQTNEATQRMQRVARELGAGWKFQAEYGVSREPVAQKGYATVYANGRGYRAIFANGHTTVTETGATPRQAVADMANAVELAITRTRRHLDEVVK